MDPRRVRSFAFGLAIIVSLASDCPPPGRVDVPASDLRLSILILDSEQSPPDGKVLVGVQFFHNNDYVELGGPTIACNGVPLPVSGLGYLARVPIQSVGGAYTFVYTRNGTPTSLAVTVPARPAITSPTAGATVARSANYTIMYTAGTAPEVTGNAFGPKAGSGTISVTGGTQPDDGSYDGLNTLGFDAGTGFVTISRKTTSSPSGTGFQSVEVKYTSGSRVAVTWN